ncbi:hypothetical protein DPMN_021287 [Dreissena polymorpha]|uniref:Uncharacterized protein n=1 Tax=Dreissena polymorpha TaxID=45954 RepID=A0A9D4NNY1_DREPO|nr:hypothetical protein DPMN_021287 [Dreissena polymorpha]
MSPRKIYYMAGNIPNSRTVAALSTARRLLLRSSSFIMSSPVKTLGCAVCRTLSCRYTCVRSDRWPNTPDGSTAITFLPGAEFPDF